MTMFNWRGSISKNIKQHKLNLLVLRKKKNENKVGWAEKAGIWEELWEGGYEQNTLHENFKELIRINKLIKNQKCN